MKESLFLNKKIVDLFPKPVTRKIRIGEVADIASRKSTYSYSIKLPRTSNNVQILDMLGVMGNTSRKPFELIVADYVVDGIPLVSNGYARISKTTEFFEINILDGVVDLGEKLKGKKISELPFGDVNHFLSTQTYIDSFNNSEGFIYAMADFGQGVSSSVKVEKQAPSIFGHTIFRKIFESSGINIVGDFFDTNEKFLSEVLTPVKGYEIIDTNVVSTSKGSVSLPQLADNDSSFGQFISFEKSFNVSGSVSGASVVSGNKIVFSVAGVYKMNLTASYSSHETRLNVYSRLNGGTISVLNLSSETSSGSGSKFRSVIFNAAAGDELEFFLFGNSKYENDENDPNAPNNSISDGNGNGTQIFNIDYSVTGSVSFFLQTGGQLIDVAEFIGDLGQLEFVKDVIQRYGLVLHPIRDTSDYRFIQLESLLNDRATAEDWTEKLKSISSEDYSSGYAKSNIAKFKYPEEIVIPSQDGEFSIENENAEAEKPLFTSVFEVPNLKTQMTGTSVYSVPIWGRDDDNQLEFIETPSKIMRIEKFEKSITVRLFSEVTGVDVTEGVPFLSLKDMSMQFFLSNNYKAFQSLVNDYKELDLIMNLTVIDVFNLDFFRLKYLRQTGRFYYLNDITHTPNKLSKVKMIEISSFPENQPPSQVGEYITQLSSGQEKVVLNSNLFNGYSDPELDEPLKIRFINGFNSELLIRNNGVEVLVDEELIVDDMNLTLFDTVGGLDAYSRSFDFEVADKGSGLYCSETGTMTVNVIELNNQDPVARAGNDQTKASFSQESRQPVLFSLSGAASFDNTGEIVSFLWNIISSPSGSSPSISNQLNQPSPTAVLTVPNSDSSFGDYIIELTVTDEYGATGTDTITASVFVGDFYGDDGSLTNNA